MTDEQKIRLYKTIELLGDQVGQLANVVINDGEPQKLRITLMEMQFTLTDILKKENWQ